MSVTDAAAAVEAATRPRSWFRWTGPAISLRCRLGRRSESIPGPFVRQPWWRCLKER